MEDARFESYAVLLRGYAAELEDTARDCVEQANHLVAGRDAVVCDGPSSGNDSQTSHILNRISGKIEQVMLAYDRLQEAVGGIPRYGPALKQLKARPALGASSPAVSD
jgi:hypothetical protein